MNSFVTFRLIYRHGLRPGGLDIPHRRHSREHSMFPGSGAIASERNVRYDRARSLEWKGDIFVVRWIVGIVLASVAVVTAGVVALVLLTGGASEVDVDVDATVEAQAAAALDDQAAIQATVEAGIQATIEAGASPASSPPTPLPAIESSVDQAPEPPPKTPQ